MSYREKESDVFLFGLCIRKWFFVVHMISARQWLQRLAALLLAVSALVNWDYVVDGDFTDAYFTFLSGLTGLNNRV